MKEVIVKELKKWTLGICEHIGGSSYTRFQFLTEQDIDEIAEEMFISIKRYLRNTKTK
jgi:hypothetical protein